uniref:40S ribosomal protein S12 n=1 Tax=Pipistrellus kuhlii TaxID=59472 RepID=A0A7J7YNQ4_PIPKU|nr:ribosomal protein S12 [Pipistrellus kuhlii]
MAEEGIAAGGVMDVNTALQEVLKTALIHDGLARGIREAAKALDKRQAHLCVLASNCDEPMYVKLVEALCAEHQINLIKVRYLADLSQLLRDTFCSKKIEPTC